MSTEQLSVNIEKIDGQMKELIEYVILRSHVATTGYECCLTSTTTLLDFDSLTRFANAI